MKVRVTFIHPITGLHDLSILEAKSVESVVTKLREMDCGVLVAEEDKEKSHC